MTFYIKEMYYAFELNGFTICDEEMTTPLPTFTLRRRLVFQVTLPVVIVKRTEMSNREQANGEVDILYIFNSKYCMLLYGC